jgi:hypothetical protein
MAFFWTREALSQYEKHFDDAHARECIDDLIEFVEDNVTHGARMSTLRAARDEWQQRAYRALRDRRLIGNARVVMANVYRDSVRSEPYALGAVVHTPSVPIEHEGSCDHSILLVGVVLRTNKLM